MAPGEAASSQVCFDNGISGLGKNGFMKIFSTSFAIWGFGQRGRCMWRNKELTPKGEDVKLITRWKHMPRDV